MGTGVVGLTLVTKTALVGLFDDCWPNATFPEPCSVSLARENNQCALTDVIELVTAYAGRRDLKARLRAEHPAKRNHHEQHDLRLWDALTEATAFAWVSVSGMGKPSFCMKPGFPDLEVPAKAWVEVKSIHLSDAERGTIERGLASGGGILVRAGGMSRTTPSELLRKFDEAFSDAVTKFERVDPDRRRRRIVWMRVGGFDWPLFPNAAWEQILRWAAAISTQHLEELVLVDAWDWRNPKHSAV